MLEINTVFEQLEEHDNLIICIRHADKILSKDIIKELTLGITNEGKKLSLQLGKLLKSKFGSDIKIKSSPIRRCVETAEFLKLGLEQPANEIELSTMLGDPGPFVKDDKEALDTFMKHSLYDIVKNQVASIMMPGLRPVNEGVKLMLQEMVQDMRQTTSPIVYITHDVIIATFLGASLDKNFTEQNWVNYLSGFCLQIKYNEMKLYLEDRSFIIDPF